MAINKSSRRNGLIPGTIIIVAMSSVIVGCKATQAPNAAAAKAAPPTVITTNVIAQTVSKDLQLPGELRAYQDVAIYPRVQGFVDSINVDRGSVVKRGQLLVKMSAPEL